MGFQREANAFPESRERKGKFLLQLQPPPAQTPDPGLHRRGGSHSPDPSLGAYLLAQANSEQTALSVSLEQSRFNLFLVNSLLPSTPTEPDYQDALQALRIRGDFETIILDEGDSYVSGPQVAPSLVSVRLAEAVSQGRLAYQGVTVEDQSYLAVGGRTSNSGPHVYFFYPQAEREEALARLRNILIGVASVLSLLGVGLGHFVARAALR